MLFIWHRSGLTFLLTYVVVWSLWGYGQRGVLLYRILEWNSFSCGILRSLFFTGDCLNSMLFGLLHCKLCNMCLVGADGAGVLMLNC